jgi:serine/threonine protein kinase
VYTASEGAAFPIKWTSPEALRFNVFSPKSDVWSFGVLMWEIYTLGSNPYPGVPLGDVLPKLDTGYRMPQPPRCPQWVYGCMLQCWQIEPDHRPSFHALRERIDGGALAEDAAGSKAAAAAATASTPQVATAAAVPLAKRPPPAVAAKPRTAPPSRTSSGTTVGSASVAGHGGHEVRLHGPTRSDSVTSIVQGVAPMRSSSGSSSGGGGGIAASRSEFIESSHSGVESPADLAKKASAACRRVIDKGHSVLQRTVDPDPTQSVEDLLIEASAA